MASEIFELFLKEVVFAGSFGESLRVILGQRGMGVAVGEGLSKLGGELCGFGLQALVLSALLGENGSL